MLVLGSSDTLGFQATNASKVTVTVTGEEISSGGVITYKTLYQGQAPAAATTEYTAPTGGAALISHIMAYNTDTVTETLSVFVKGTAAVNTVGEVAIPAGGMATFDRDGWKVYPTSVSVVTSFNNRTGAVTPGNADYLAMASGGLTGAVAAARLVGGTTSGAPSSGTFAVGDVVVDQTGALWVCIVAGSPGTWIAPGNPQGASVGANEATTSTAYTNLATVGPAVTLTCGKRALVQVAAACSQNTGSNLCFMAFTISGANTVAAGDGAAIFQAFTGGANGNVCDAVVVTGLSPGSNTFTCKYRVNGGTGNFYNRRIVVTPLP